jgi:elongation factor Ts
MMECKKALTEAEGNMERAEELLRVKLGSKAGKAASRITAEGVIAVAVTGNAGAIVEVNCETDFTSKNDMFLALANACARLVAEKNPADVAALSALAYSQDGYGPTLEDVRKGPSAPSARTCRSAASSATKAPSSRATCTARASA